MAHFLHLKLTGCAFWQEWLHLDKSMEVQIWGQKSNVYFPHRMAKHLKWSYLPLPVVLCLHLKTRSFPFLFLFQNLVHTTHLLEPSHLSIQLHMMTPKTKATHAWPADDTRIVHQRRCLVDDWSINLLDNLIGIIDKIHITTREEIKLLYTNQIGI